MEYCFSVKLAGIPVEIRCRYPQNRRFFRDYCTESPGVFRVAPTEDDVRAIRTRYERLYGPEPRPAWFWENQAIHWKAAEGLLLHDVLLFHASALTLDGDAFLFTADSGTGKSTHARLWRECFGERVSMLNDDKPLLKVADGEIYACGTPWDGKHHLSRNAVAPIRAIVELERDRVNHIGPCPDPFRVLYLHALRCADPDLCRHILRLERDIIERVPFYRLGCNMDPDAARIALRGIEQSEQRRPAP